MKPMGLYADPRVVALCKTIDANRRAREAAGRDHWTRAEWKNFVGTAFGQGLKKGVYGEIAEALRNGATDDDMTQRFGTDLARDRIAIRDGIERELREQRRSQPVSGQRRRRLPEDPATVEADDDSPIVLL